jgi:CheY-like chemotaxis protein
MRVLYVDDDPEDAEVFCEVIKTIDAAIHCEVCIKHTDVTGYLREICPDYVFLDYRMPIIDGKEILTTLQKHDCFPSMKIIMYSTVMSDLDMAECKKLGAHDCIQKLGNFQELRELVAATLGIRK